MGPPEIKLFQNFHIIRIIKSTITTNISEDLSHHGNTVLLLIFSEIIFIHLWIDFKSFMLQLFVEIKLIASL